MSHFLERGHHLLTLERYTEAEKELRKELSQNPNNPFALAFLAECYLETDRRPEALQLAQQAIGIEAGTSFLYHVLARCYYFNKEMAKAKLTIHEGLRLAPHDPIFFLLLAQIDFYDEEWQKCLDNAEKGLQLDPENVNLINLRAQALVKLNRQEEAAETLSYALNKAPENDYSHANKGWVAIEQDKYDEAVNHFKESLRLNPTNAYAKAGLREAIKAKNVLYKYVLKYFLWMGKLQAKSRWAFMIGIYVLYQIILNFASTSPLLAKVLSPIIILYILFAFSSWIAMPISNLFLRFHPFGKYALEKDEILASNICGLLMVGFIACLSIFYILGNTFYLENNGLYVSEGGELLFNFGLVFCLMLIPTGGLFASEEGSLGRKKMTLFTIIIAAMGLFAAITSQSWAFNFFFVGVFIFSFSANYFIQQASKEV